MKQISQFLQRLKDKNNSTLLIFIFLILAGCAAKMLKMYEGPERPLEEVAVVKSMSGLTITKVDGKRVKAKSVVVKPGLHILNICYRYKRTYYNPGDRSTTSYYYRKIYPRIVKLKVGKTYLVKKSNIGKLEYPLLVWVEDTDTGENVSSYIQSIHEAVEAGDIAAVKLNLKVNPEQVNSKKRNGWTSLHYAAWYGYNDVAELLIAKGAEVNEMDTLGDTPIYNAVIRGHKKIVELLIANGAEVDIKSKGGWSPLHFAAQKGHRAIVKLLIENGAEVNAKTNNSITPLGIAVKQSHNDTADLLRKHGGVK